MKVAVTVTRYYEMDEARVLCQRDFEPPTPDASADEKREWLMESFYELCGFARDEDHLDGTYVWLIDEDENSDFEWPEALR